MSDPQCLGLCMIDPDTGACMGCGRLPEEISGVPTGESNDRPHRVDHEHPASPRDRLPPAVADQAADPQD